MSGNLGLKLLSEMAHIQSPFLLFHGLHDEHFFSFLIKIEGVTVPAHFLQNGGCDVIRMKFSKNEKKHHWQIAARPQIPSGVEIRPAVQALELPQTDTHRHTDKQKDRVPSDPMLGRGC